MEQYKIDFESIEWQSPVAGVRFKAYQQGGRKMRLVEYTKEFVEQNWLQKDISVIYLKGKWK